jgi:demethylmenaquinone methyltransferase/2-methoxy-6-polyprenyl-1,4-benzoquinol methylase
VLTDRRGEALPQGDEKAAAVRSMFDTIAPRYDLVNRIMTFRLDVGWRRHAVRMLGLAPGSVVVDVACGTGDLCLDLAGDGLRPVGVDFSRGMLRAGRDRVGTIPLVQGDAQRLPFGDASVDGVVSGFALRNFVDLRTFLDECGRVVRPGGRIALLEVATPPSALMRAGHAIYFGRIVPLLGGLVSGNGAAYRYLPRSVSYLPDVDELLDLVRGAGFATVQRHLLSGGIAQLLTGTRS